jgi:hypothetical protein
VQRFTGVIAGLDPAIHFPSRKRWMPGTSPGMTAVVVKDDARDKPGHDAYISGSATG